MTVIREPSAFVCTVTCFTEDGQLDDAANRALFERIAAAGIGVYMGTASPGEGHSLTRDETARFYRTAADTLKGRVPVRAMGVEPRHASQFLELIRIAEDVDLDAMQIYSVDMGHGNIPTQAELERYYRTLLEQMKIPGVISAHMYNGYLPSLGLVDRLLDDYPHLIGFNLTNPDLAAVCRFVDTVDGRADVHVGGPMQALNVFAFGGQGFLHTEGNFAPRLAAEVIRAQKAGDHNARDAAYASIIRLMAINRWSGGSVRFVKAAMTALGLPGGHLRAPYAPLDDAAQAEIKTALQALGAEAWM